MVLLDLSLTEADWLFRRACASNFFCSIRCFSSGVNFITLQLYNDNSLKSISSQLGTNDYI